jgi:hypothetical protein
MRNFLILSKKATLAEQQFSNGADTIRVILFHETHGSFLPAYHQIGRHLNLDVLGF